MLTATGQDLILSEDKFEVGRNFGTKIWNAARYIEMNCGDRQFDVRNPNIRPELLRPDDIYILSCLGDAVEAFNTNLDRYRLNDAALALYEFIWHQYCDWYVESSKVVLNGEDAAKRENVLAIMHVAFWGALRLLHPIMPFLTEELAHMLGYISDGEFLMHQAFPARWTKEERTSMGMTAEIVAYVQAKHELIRSARTLMADYSVLPSHKVRFILRSTNGDLQGLLESDKASLVGLLRVGDVEVRPDYVPESATPSMLTPMGAIYMPAAGLIDLDAERARLGKQLHKIENDLGGVEGKLNNSDFTDRAPEHVVQLQVDKRVELKETRDKIFRLIEALGSHAQS
jgi:valyl-tRNA synthetase